MDLNAVQVLFLGCIGILLGGWLKRRLRVLDRLYIPTSIVGGLVFALVALALHGRYAVRHSDSVQAMQLPTYVRGLSPNSCHKDGPGEVGAIIACGGVAVRPGDIIVADSDGVTVVPLDDAAEVAALTKVQIEREAKRLSEIEKGVIVRPEIDETLRKLKIID